ncbi:MAG: EAL domain-containing protein [Pseudomonadota bacterium]
MSKIPSSLVRPLGPRDHLRFPQLAEIKACLDRLNNEAPTTVAKLISALGAQAGQVTLCHPEGGKSYRYVHFGSQIARDAGFDMTGKSTADFDTRTRQHLEQSFDQVLRAGTPLCTIMAGSVSGSAHSWQRIVFPVRLVSGDHLLAVVIPLKCALDAIHGRHPGVSVCVLPLRQDESTSALKLATERTLIDYLGQCDLEPLRTFVRAFKMRTDTPDVGSLLATMSAELQGDEGGTVQIIADIVHGFTTPFLVVSDATRASKANHDLRSAAHMLQASCEVGKLGWWIKHRYHDDQLEIAPELAEIFGLQLDQDGRINHDVLRGHYHHDLIERIEEAVERCWQTGESYAVNGRFERPDGQWIDITISGRPMRDETGSVRSLFGIVQDTTEHQSAKRKLEESEARFRDFAGSAGDWCWETDQDHRFVDFTEDLADVGHTLQRDFIGKTRYELPVLPEDQPVVDAHYDDLEAHREFSNLVYRLKDPDSGRVLTFKIAGKPRFAANGAFLGYRGTGRNITAEVAAGREHEERLLALRNAQSIAGLGHWVTDLTSGTTRWSQGILRLFHFDHDLSDDPDKLVDAPGFHLTWLLRRVHREDRRKITNALRCAENRQASEPIDLRYYPDNEQAVRHMRVQLRYQPATKMTPARLMGVAQDVSDLKTVQAELERRTKALGEAQAMGGLGDWQFDANTGLSSWSPQLYSILRFDPNDIKPSRDVVDLLCSAEDAAAIRHGHEIVLSEGEKFAIDVQMRRGDGTMGYYSIATQPLRDDDGSVSGLFGTVQDITERKHAEKQLRSLAYFDPLTGLGNRALFTRELNDVMAEIIQAGGSAALLLLDLDHFKEVNDTLGHAAGDELLKQISVALREIVDERGFVARLGGDEFAVIIRDYQSVQCLRRLADRIVDRLSGAKQLKRGEVVTGTSIGIALIPQDGGTDEEVLRNADLALYMAKDDGRGRALFFEHAMSRSVQARLQLARDLRTAIENDGFETRYQGQIDLRTGNVVGFETLLRWEHPTRGYISPAEFIPIAESSSLIAEIGLWVLRDACQTGRAWLDAGETPRMIAVNVSAAQIWQPEFASEVLAIVEETGYPPDLLCLELTESVFADHSESRVRKALDRFRSAGIHLALDDFGTGYSSLGYLNELPFNELKIDRCFISGAHESEEKSRLLKGIIALGKGLNMRVVGEGAEVDGEVDLLRESGCDLVQGFVYMRPEPAKFAIRSADQLEFRHAELRSNAADTLEQTA